MPGVTGVQEGISRGECTHAPTEGTGEEKKENKTGVGFLFLVGGTESSERMRGRKRPSRVAGAKIQESGRFGTDPGCAERVGVPGGGGGRCSGA